MIAWHPPASGIGQSQAAREIERIEQSQWERLLTSYSLGASLGESARALLHAAQEAALPNWDGYGAQPVDQAAYGKALVFLCALPSTVPRPELTIDPDGTVAMDWDFGRRRALTATISGSGRVVVAWVNGTSSGHAMEWFDGRTPDTISAVIALLKRAGC